MASKSSGVGSSFLMIFSLGGVAVVVVEVVAVGVTVTVSKGNITSACCCCCCCCCSSEFFNVRFFKRPKKGIEDFFFSVSISSLPFSLLLFSSLFLPNKYNDGSLRWLVFLLLLILTLSLRIIIVVGLCDDNLFKPSPRPPEPTERSSLLLAVCIVWKDSVTIITPLPGKPKTNATQTIATIFIERKEDDISPPLIKIMLSFDSSCI
mmetsp:Transcript_5924/g.6912  ORF Transcript_5924/g.6912 Transcript_5924/m.6912 type:complete len:207 (-) Transcript_5924:133-753(-)